MAGIEQLEIHSKAFVVRWVQVEEGHTISWSVQPHKRSINFGIVKHPGTGGTTLATYYSDAADSQTDGAFDSGKSASGGLFAKKDATTTAIGRLRNKGFQLMNWHGKCDADKVSMGTYDVQPGNGGMFGLVFDNTFSKQTSKNATFVLLTYPTGAPPQGASNLPNLQLPASNVNANNASRSSLGHNGSPRLGAHASDSVDSFNSHLAIGATGTSAAATTAGFGGSVSGGIGGSSSSGAATANCHVGTLEKRRRRRGQGYARRFFSLDYASCTLSYYYNRNSSALRGAIPLSFAAIAADERRRTITIDSGAEVWHLKAPNADVFTGWARALERASRIARGIEHLPEPIITTTNHRPQVVVASANAAVTTGASSTTAPTTATTGAQSGVEKISSLSPIAVQNNLHEEAREWKQVEALVSRIVGSRDAVRRLVKDMDAAAGGGSQQQQVAPSHSHFLSPSTPAVLEEANGAVPGSTATPVTAMATSFGLSADRRPFWRRRSSASPHFSQGLQPTVASTLAVPTPSSVPSISPSAGGGGGGKVKSAAHNSLLDEHNMQNHCRALLSDLDSVVAEFTSLLAASKRRRGASATAVSAAPRKSFESASTTDEFFDAAELATDGVQVVHIDDHSEAEADDVDNDTTPGFDSAHDDNASESSAEDDKDYSGLGGDDNQANAHSWYPAKPKSLWPLPINQAVSRRASIPPSTVLPPSLIAFVRKNVGKDLSTISMPASANEPISLLQRMAEYLEYCQLLNQAAAQKRPEDRLIYVAAFAMSQFSSGRVKERAIRKPFNPLLGETYELVRTEKEVPGGFRLLVEKVSHRPVRLVMQADAAAWSLATAPLLSQKFWGKSAEVITEGRVRMVLRLPDGTDEHYSWATATVFLRNVVMGEKYVEPVGTMHVVNDRTGAKAAIEFRTKGMFGGRSEDVQVETYDANGEHTGLSLTGTWTSALRVVNTNDGKARKDHGDATGSSLANGTVVWTVGDLVENSRHVYGLTRFAATLNEITELERDKLPPTDSRLRPDQRLAENGQLDEAEVWKASLEDSQRMRRHRLQESGEEYHPRWFAKVAEDADGEEVWRIKNGKDGYWEERARASWEGVSDIFKPLEVEDRQAA